MLSVALLVTLWQGIASKKDVLGLALRLLALGALVVGLSWMILTLLAVAAEIFVVAPWRRLKEWARERAARRRERELETRAERERLFKLANRPSPAPPADFPAR